MLTLQAPAMGKQTQTILGCKPWTVQEKNEELDKHFSTNMCCTIHLFKFAVNAEGDPNINLLIILLAGMILYILVWVFGSAYKHLLVGLQESVFIVLSCLLVSASLYNNY